MEVHGYGAADAAADLAPVMFDRSEPRAGEVAIEIVYCGVCHSDLHQVRDDWGNTNYPCVPGHEIVGRVTATGEGVSGFVAGDLVGVGCMVNSCRTCSACERGDEQYCSGPKSCTLTYNGPKMPDGTNTYGGYSDAIVVHEEFVIRIPDDLAPQAAAPILCAGITVYSPMKQFDLKAGQRLGVAGIGGLGHMAVSIGKALGAHVVALTRSPGKADEIKAMGADEVLITTDEAQMEAAAMSLDMLINTIPVAHDIAPYLDLMKPNSHAVIVGNMIGFEAFSPGPLVFHRIALSGSLIGGIADTQEVIDLCAKHGIAPQIRVIGVDDINGVLKELEQGESTYRNVIDMATLKAKRANWSPERVANPDRGAVVGR